MFSRLWPTLVWSWAGFGPVLALYFYALVGLVLACPWIFGGFCPPRPQPLISLLGVCGLVPSHFGTKSIIMVWRVPIWVKGRKLLP